MFLSKKKIKEAVQKGDIGVTDFNEELLKAASYTLTLGPLKEGSSLTLPPGAFVLLETKEKVTLNGKYCGFMMTPAHLARQGVHMTQGSDFAEPDTDNTMILEVSNNGNEPVVFTSGMRVLKIAFAPIL
jgi:deoxycytidine triphosphate deaminase